MNITPILPILDLSSLESGLGGDIGIYKYVLYLPTVIINRLYKYVIITI